MRMFLLQVNSELFLHLSQAVVSDGHTNNNKVYYIILLNEVISEYSTYEGNFMLQITWC